MRSLLLAVCIGGAGCGTAHVVPGTGPRDDPGLAAFVWTLFGYVFGYVAGRLSGRWEKGGGA